MSLTPRPRPPRKPAQKRYCEMCDRWMLSRMCRACGMPTRKAVQ